MQASTALAAHYVPGRICMHRNASSSLVVGMRSLSRAAECDCTCPSQVVRVAAMTAPSDLTGGFNRSSPARLLKLLLIFESRNSGVGRLTRQCAAKKNKQEYYREG